ncbi:MAG: acyl-CoA dehydrogenase family protein [Candidatus Eremiobacteraeota bacterium]|nr:acyl-CoA dehydrogenase family protein [Candidatus Eremiobacteraeota bacterium]
MNERDFLGWPFFNDAHRQFARELDAWLTTQHVDHDNVDAACRTWVVRLGEAGWLQAIQPPLDLRKLCLARETLARYDGLADFAFAMQGLGSVPIALFGGETLHRRYVPNVASGTTIAAFALSEKAAGSDVAAIRTSARREGSRYVIDGEKTWISNGGIADFYIVFARSGGEGARGLSAFVVDADSPGLTIAERIDVLAPHPLATLRFDGCTVSEDQRVGREGDGFKIAMATLDFFRSTVAAAALGFARRALEETIAHVKTRRLFGTTLGDLQMTQAKVAEMATDIDASALLVYRAAFEKDRGKERVTSESSMAKWFSTEAAQRVIDSAVQLFGGRGVTRGEIVERLYREIRALRIYEGASEIQQLVIARQILAASST